MNNSMSGNGMYHGPFNDRRNRLWIGVLLMSIAMVLPFSKSSANTDMYYGLFFNSPGTIGDRQTNETSHGGLGYTVGQAVADVLSLEARVGSLPGYDSISPENASNTSAVFFDASMLFYLLQDSEHHLPTDRRFISPFVRTGFARVRDSIIFNTELEKRYLSLGFGVELGGGTSGIGMRAEVYALHDDYISTSVSLFIKN